MFWERPTLFCFLRCFYVITGQRASCESRLDRLPSMCTASTIMQTFPKPELRVSGTALLASSISYFKISVLVSEYPR